MGEIVQGSVNETTRQLAITEPVSEIGKVLPRLFHFMASMPEDQEIRLSKVDLSDGFWRLLVEPAQKWNFCYVMPDPPGSRVRIVVPLALQMGWAEIPAYFCTATETGRDTIALLLREGIDLPGHPLEEFMKPKDVPRTAPPGSAEQTPVGVMWMITFWAWSKMTRDHSSSECRGQPSMQFIPSSRQRYQDTSAARTQFLARNWRKEMPDLTSKRRSWVSRPGDGRRNCQDPSEEPCVP
jgi:hypothetical protein